MTIDTKNMTEIEHQMLTLGKQAKESSLQIAKASSQKKAQMLFLLAELLEKQEKEIIAANKKDLENARKKELDEARMDRLKITPTTVKAMAAACRQVANQDDPVGEILGLKRQKNGILLGQMRIPLGVIAMIYESRPNVTIDAAILCLKAGNAVILRGGSEAFFSNQTLGKILHEALEKSELPTETVQLLATTDRAAVNALLKLDEYIDVVIPRGGEELIRAVVSAATMPVLKHYKGVCHIFVDESADLKQAEKIIENAKTQRTGVCNALECLLVHEKIAATFLPQIQKRLALHGVHFKACSQSLPFLGETAEAATTDDWGREFLSLQLAVKIVSGQDEAQNHIAQYGSHHSEVILTNDHEHAMRFLREVDASAVMVNASTRFNDGGEFGLGAEIGICTSKLHAYGPMGVQELTGKKFIVFGDGQIRQ